MRFYLKILFIIFFLFSGCSEKDGQFKEIETFVKAWNKSKDLSTYETEKIYGQFRSHTADTIKLKKHLALLYHYEKTYPNKRLRAWILLYDVYSGHRYGINSTAATRLQKRKEVIKLAVELNDLTLLSESYDLLDIKSHKAPLLHHLKALELQRKVGLRQFSFIQYRLFNVSLALYNTNEFNESINYGLSYLKLDKEDLEVGVPEIYIYQLDILGASYKQLNKLDSAEFYYNGILDTLSKKSIANVAHQKLWLGIANGNLGHILSLRNDHNGALPLIEQHLKTSLDLDSWNNAAMAQNNLSATYLKKKQFIKAVEGYKKAYKYAIKSNAIKEKIISTRALANLSLLNNQSSDFIYYNNLFQTYQDSLNVNIMQNNLAAVRSKMIYDDTEQDLRLAKATIEKNILNQYLLIIICLIFTLIIIFIYRRKVQKDRLLMLNVEKKHDEAILSVQNAKKQLKIFTNNLSDRDNLITNLQLELSNFNSNDSLGSLLKTTLVTDIEWEKFRIEFSKAYPDIIPKLRDLLDHITPAEERLTALLFLKLTDHQIANNLGISKDSVGRSKRRLKQRLNLTNSLDNYIAGLRIT